MSLPNSFDEVNTHKVLNTSDSVDVSITDDVLGTIDTSTVPMDVLSKRANKGDYI